MKIKTLNTFSVVTLPLAPCQTEWFQNEIDLSETELNPLAPCQTEWFQNLMTLRCLLPRPLAPCQTEWFQNLASSI